MTRAHARKSNLKIIKLLILFSITILGITKTVDGVKWSNREVPPDYPYIIKKLYMRNMDPIMEF